MAEIFKAKTYSHGGFENLLVIKRILPHIGENDDFIEMFIDEAKVSVALQHPNIVRIYDFGKIHDNYFIAMECVDGKDARNVLRQMARRRHFMPPRYCAYIALETCKGLAYAHAKGDLQGNPYGIVHRDISPSNVIVSYEGEVKIADFGIAKAKSNAYQTRDGILKGKFEYMSPEQATGKEIDQRSDLFSLGIILYEMLTGRRLFKTDSEIATLKKIRDCDFEPPRRMNSNIPEDLEKVVMKALARYPEDRYQNASEMAEDLRQHLLPDNADRIRVEFSEFLADLFKDQIVEEITRLEENSTIALELKENAPDAWDGHTTSTINEQSKTGQTHIVWWGIGTIAMAVGLSIVIVTGGIYYSNASQPEPIAIEVATTGALRVMVLPQANIFLDGEKRGRGGTLSFDNIQPGEHTLRFEEEGFETYESKTWIKAGEEATLPYTLKAVPKPKPQVEVRPTRPSTPRPQATGPGKLTVTLSGGGWANVYIDGKKVSKTAPFKDFSLSAGTHKIKVENPALGIAHEQQVTVSSGGSTTVRARPQ
ncbi:MAG: protein kinase [Rhodobacterales bacterium]|nr:protein kinase [Rhodobacterales bacterium]